MCDVPNVTVFYSEAVESFLGMASKFFFKTYATIPVAQVTSCVIHFMFQIHYIFILSLFTIIIKFYVCDLLFQI